MPVLIEEISSTNENTNDETKQIQEDIPELEKNNFNIEPIPFEDKTNRIELNEKKVENEETKLNLVEENKNETKNDSSSSTSSVSTVTSQAPAKQSAYGPSVRY
jgi:hypothetical protein